MSMTLEQLQDCRGQNILVLEPFYYTPHLETGMEISETLAEQNTVTYVGPDVLKCVSDETYKFSSRVLIAFSRKRHASKFLSKEVGLISAAEVAEITGNFTPLDAAAILDGGAGDITTAMYENFDLGMGVLSSLLSLTRDTNVDFNDHRDYALALAQDAIMLYQLTTALIQSKRIDVVVLFNGRLAPVRAIRRACETADTRYLVHERGSSTNKYAVYDCSTPHLPVGYRQWTDAWWRIADDPLQNARHFLDNRRRGVPTSWYSFIGKQVQGRVPEKSNKRRRIVFYTSSEDELAAIGDELRPDTPFCDQIASIRSLASICKEQDFEFVIRFHPNTSTKETALIQAAQEASEIVCLPSSDVDSYALLESSDIVFTHNSTIGIEAAATGKPVFYTGRSIFECCTSIRRIKTQGDLSQALTPLAELDPLDALKYANFLGAHGIEYRHYRPRGIVSGTYRGKDMNAPLAGLRELKLRLTRGGR